jgi:TP901 family phage tail tape measure protein
MANGSQHVIELILRARDEASKGLESAMGGLRNLAAEADRVGQSMQMAGGVLLGAGGGMAAGLAGAASVAANYQQSMNVLQASSGATAAQMERMGQLAIELGADMSLPATSAADAGRAMTSLVQSGLSVNNTMAAARGTLQLAAAAQLDEARAAEITANALNAFKLPGTEATRVANLLAAGSVSAGVQIEQLADALQMAGSVFASAGVPIQDLITMMGEMGRAGVKGSDAGTSLKTMMLRLETPTAQAAAMLQKFGIGVYNSQGAMLSMPQIIAQFSGAMGGLTQAQRDQALGTIFGSDAIRAAQIVLMGGVGAFNQMSESVNRQGAAADLAGARMKGLGGAVEGIKSQMETFLMSAVIPILPALENIGRGIAVLIGRLTEWSDAHPGLLANITMTAAGVLILSGVALLAGGTLLRLAVSAVTLGGSLATGVIGVAALGISLLSLIGATVLATARFIIMAITGNLSLGSMIASFAAWAAAGLAAMAAIAAPILIGIGVVGLLYLAWRNNFLGIQGVTKSVVDWIGGKLQELLGFINKVLVGIGLAPVNWGTAWKKMGDSVTTFTNGVKGGDILGGITGAMGLGKAADLASQFNLPSGALATGVTTPAGTDFTPIIADTGTKLSELASAAQSAIGSIGGMAQSASEASIGLGAMKGLTGMGPGQNGPLENLYRVQDIAQNLGVKDRKEEKGQGPLETNKWATTLIDQNGAKIADIAKSLGMNLQGYSQMVTLAFQQKQFEDPEVKRWIDIPKWQQMLTTQYQGEIQTKQIGADVLASSPELTQLMLKAQGLNATPGQAGQLTDIIKSGQLEAAAKGAFDVVAPPLNNNTAALGNATIAINNLSARFGAVGPTGPQQPQWQSISAKVPVVTGPASVVASQAALASGASGGTAGSALFPPLARSPLATYLVPQAPAPSGTEASTAIANFLNSAAVRAVVKPESAASIKATAPANQTMSVSVVVSADAIKLGGDADTTGRAKSFGSLVAETLKQLAMAEMRMSVGAPVSLPGTR